MYIMLEAMLYSVRCVFYSRGDVIRNVLILMRGNTSKSVFRFTPDFELKRSVCQLRSKIHRGCVLHSDSGGLARTGRKKAL
jgi:hypothetical protein